MDKMIPNWSGQGRQDPDNATRVLTMKRNGEYQPIPFCNTDECLNQQCFWKAERQIRAQREGEWNGA